jgi:hypothetical protein
LQKTFETQVKYREMGAAGIREDKALLLAKEDLELV